MINLEISAQLEASERSLQALKDRLQALNANYASQMATFAQRASHLEAKGDIVSLGISYGFSAQTLEGNRFLAEVTQYRLEAAKRKTEAYRMP